MKDYGVTEREMGRIPMIITASAFLSLVAAASFHYLHFRVRVRREHPAASHVTPMPDDFLYDTMRTIRCKAMRTGIRRVEVKDQDDRDSMDATKFCRTMDERRYI